MNEISKTNRRSFLGKMVSGTVGLTVTASAGQALFGADHAMQHANTKSTGISSDDRKFVPVMITPYNSNGKIDFDGLSRLIDFYLAAGVKGFFANCASSEMYALEPEERLALARHVVKYVNGAVPVVATGSFGETAEERAEFTKKMYHTGVDAVIIITSHFAAKEEDDTTFIHNLEKFLTLTDNIPLGTYECPSPYKRILTPETFRFLLSTNRFIYHKDTTLELEKIKVKLELAKNSRLEFYDAHSPNTMFSLQMGAKGMSSIAGNFYPELFVWMCNNFSNPARQEDVKWLQSEITKTDKIISQGYPVSSKYFLQKRGVPIQPISRTNKTPLTTQQQQALDETYRQLLTWHERLGIQIVH